MNEKFTENIEYCLEFDDRDIADVMIENHFNISRDIADVMIEQPQPIVVGLTDDQLIDLIKALSISSTDEQFNARLDFAREWLKAQTFSNDTEHNEFYLAGLARAKSVIARAKY